MTVRAVVAMVTMIWGCSTCSDSATRRVDAPAGNGPPYRLEVKAPGTAAVGEATSTQVIVTPQQGFKINLEYPAKLTMGTVPGGVQLTAPEVTKSGMSVTKMRLVVPVGYTLVEAGNKRLEGELRFSVCNDQTCQMPRETVSWTTEGEATQ